VVLTTLLATVGVLFVLLSRIDKMAASAASQNRELNFAIDTVVAKISQDLVLDVPGVDPNVNVDYYDYPGTEDKWLASLEPCQVAANNYRWPQISDVYNRLAGQAWNLKAEIISDYQNPGEVGNGLSADADGDGVADSCWVVIPDVNSSKGKPIYAAIRIIDNGGMLNVNTAYKFDPNEPRERIDGHSQLQINLLALSARGSTTNPLGKLDDARFGSEPHVLDNYINDVVWRYNSPNGAYTPFDISDELELRNRFLINLPDTETRIENVWTNAFKNPNLRTPVPSDPCLPDWFYRAQHDVMGLNDIYSYRHIGTTCNMDRIIKPDGSKMLNINTASAQALYNVLQGIIDFAAQLAVNIVDLRDDNNDVTSFDPDPPGGQIYYGFERPCIYISELVDYNLVTPGNPPTIHTSYAVELYKPYSEDSVPGPGFWRIAVDGAPINIDSWPAGKSFYVVQKQDPSAKIPVDANAVEKPYPLLVFAANSRIELQRSVIDPNGAPKYITVDSNQVPGWLVSGNGLRSFQRDITKHKCIRRLWVQNPIDPSTNTPTLGSMNSYVDSSTGLIQAHPANRLFTNIGEIGMVFRNSAYNVPVGVKESDIRLNLADLDSSVQRIFNYLTVIDPNAHGLPLSEKRIKGRININTAPWFVIAQLPWVSQRKGGYYNTALAQAIVAYRDKTSISGGPNYSWREEPGFRSIGELMNVSIIPPSGDLNYSICYYGLDDGIDQMGFPDLTTDPRTGVDGAPNDFEERDLIFSRISNLVTVRSDVFTAYILVRIGPNGPQRRVVAILDRSRVPEDKVKIIALQPVPDPR
jgi:DNA uptake protein ComE-like DNA-binding protein